MVEEADGGSRGVWIKGDRMVADNGDRAPVNIYMPPSLGSGAELVFSRSSCGARFVLGSR